MLKFLLPWIQFDSFAVDWFWFWFRLTRPNLTPARFLQNNIRATRLFDTTSQR